MKAFEDGGTQMVISDLTNRNENPHHKHGTLIWFDTADSSSPGFRLLCILLGSQAWEARAAGRRRDTHQRNPWDRNQDIDQYATHLTQLGWPLVQNLGFSGAVGLVCAVAFKVEFACCTISHACMQCNRIAMLQC